MLQYFVKAELGLIFKISHTTIIRSVLLINN